MYTCTMNQSIALVHIHDAIFLSVIEDNNLFYLTYSRDELIRDLGATPMEIDKMMKEWNDSDMDWDNVVSVYDFHYRGQA